LQLMNTAIFTDSGRKKYNCYKVYKSLLNDFFIKKDLNPDSNPF